MRLKKLTAICLCLNKLIEQADKRMYEEKRKKKQR